jgi:Bacteriophage related domain of unknown function
MSGWNSVHEALISAAWARLEEAAIGLNGANDVEWPNKALTPPATNTGVFSQPVWAKVSIITNPGVPVTQGQQGKDEVDGILQIDLNQPKNTGDSEVRTALGALENYFTPGRVLSKDGEDVTVSSCGRVPGRVIDDRHFRVSLSVSWYARVQRQLLT